MDTDAAGNTTLRPAPDAVVIAGALLSISGYLLPWFRIGERYRWWISGWEYTTADTGGGWTLLTLGWLAVALIAGIWARTAVATAMVALVSAVGGLVFALCVVAVSTARLPERTTLNWVGELPFGAGLPVMALGFGMLLAGAVRAVINNVLDDRYGSVAP